MGTDDTVMRPPALRRVDGNSLLRMYDAARARAAAAASPPARAKADRALGRIDDELRRRRMTH
jgi:hypothetical protein